MPDELIPRELIEPEPAQPAADVVIVAPPPAQADPLAGLHERLNAIDEHILLLHGAHNSHLAQHASEPAREPEPAPEPEPARDPEILQVPVEDIPEPPQPEAPPKKKKRRRSL